MRSLINIGNSSNTNVHEYRQLSTDPKPTVGVPNGSIIEEMDTSKIYFFDAENVEWIEWGASS